VNTVWPGRHWHAATGAADLDSSVVHVWSIDLDLPEAEKVALRGLLSADERARADRLRIAEKRDRFIACRGILRKLLAHYLNMPPSSVALEYTTLGKPRLCAAAGQPAGLYFSVAHSHALALVALSRLGEVGVDVEKMALASPQAQLAGRYFSAQEAAWLQALAPEHQAAAFYRCWTLKEAYLKATGLGLTQPLHSFTVTPDCSGQSARLALSADAAESAAWSLQTLVPAEGYVAALAIRSRAYGTRCMHYAPYDRQVSAGR